MTLPNQRLDNSTRPGQMTSAMRASASALLRPHGPRLLRVGVVHDGRIREDRIFRSACDVSVGTSEDNSFLLAGSSQPTSFRLFERVGDVYHLNFSDDMQGRVALESSVFPLGELKSMSERVGSGTHRVALTDTARGKVVLGDVTFLFHFVEPPPLQPKPVLPTAVLRGEASVDWTSTLCAAVSFLLHFMILCAVYSDWADPVIDDDLRTAGLVDSLKNLPPPPAIEEKVIPDDAPSPVREDVPKARETPSQASRAKDGQHGNVAPSPTQTDNARLVSELAQIDTSIIGVLSKPGPATAGVLQRNDVGWSSLDVAAASPAGVGNGAEPKLTSAGAPIRGGNFKDFREFGTKTRGTEDQGRVAVVSGPRAVTTIAPLSTSGGALSNAARVVAGMRAGFRACYQRGLAENPDAAGGIKLTIRVGPGGEVLSVAASPSGNIPAMVLNCVQARARAAQFDPPEGGAAVVSVPVTFIKQ